MVTANIDIRVKRLETLNTNVSFHQGSVMEIRCLGFGKSIFKQLLLNRKVPEWY